MKFDIIVSDPCWEFGDTLDMSNTPRSAKANYKTLTDEDIINLDVKNISSDNSVLSLWVPCSKLEIGMKTMSNWGFEQKQVFVWVKSKKNPLDVLVKNLRKEFRNLDINTASKSQLLRMITDGISIFDINDVLNFYMGRLFRQTHEIALVGTRGSVYKYLDAREKRSQRSVFIAPIGKHSEKPEGFQDKLDIMFPSQTKLEMFARRDRPGWTCVGLECPSTLKEDIRDSIVRLKNL
jgi:N6-adenosine-specific RNA methylase IME4